MCGGVSSVKAPPNTLKGYVVALHSLWFAGSMINFVPEAIWQSFPMTGLSPNSG